MTRPRTKTIDGYRIQPMLPIGIVFARRLVRGRRLHGLRRHSPASRRWCASGSIKSPYTLVLTIAQALDADIIERA